MGMRGYPLGTHLKAEADNFGLLEVVKKSAPIFREMIKAAPPNTLIDWKLVWIGETNLYETWFSPVVQLGDVAHPCLPTAGYGATQAIEGGFM